MTNNLKRWLKSALIMPLLMGTGQALSADGVQRGPFVNEQVLGATNLGGGNKQAGGFSVAIDGDWAFVGNITKCQVFVYKWDPLTNLWGDGDVDGDGTTDVGVPYTTLINALNDCNANGTGGFGRSVSTDNGLVVVGAPLAKDGGGINWGKIHFFSFDENDPACTPAMDTDLCRNGWERVTTIGWPEDFSPLNTYPADDNAGSPIPDKQQDAGFGSSVSIRFDSTSTTALLVAGAPGYDYPEAGDPGEILNRGKIYAYEWDKATKEVTFAGSQLGHAAEVRLGQTVTSNGDQLLASAPFAAGVSSGHANTGEVFHYDYFPSIVIGGIFFLPGKIVELARLGEASFLPDPLPVNQQLGISLSYSGNLMGLGGLDSYILEHPAKGSYIVKATETGTNGGDISQNGPYIDIATRGGVAGTPVGASKIWFDKTTITPANYGWHYTKTEEDYGRDVSLSFPKLMVNGNKANGSKQGVAYAYYPACGLGGELIKDEWQVIGIQCVASILEGVNLRPATILEIFGPDLGGHYDTGQTEAEWVIYARQAPNYDGRSNSYVKLLPGDTLDVGVGYFIVWIGDAAKPTDTSRAYQMHKPIIGLHINKVYDALAADPLRNTHIEVTTDLDLKEVMYPGGVTDPYGRAGPGSHSDLRVLLANPLLVDADWGDTSITVENSTKTVGPGGLHPGADVLFESDLPIAWLYNPLTDWWTPVSPDGTPGFRADIPAGQGFSVNFNALMKSAIVNSTQEVKFHIAEEKE